MDFETFDKALRDIYYEGESLADHYISGIHTQAFWEAWGKICAVWISSLTFSPEGRDAVLAILPYWQEDLRYAYTQDMKGRE